MKAFIVYTTHTSINDETIIQLFGRLENSQSFCTLNKFSPYFYVRKKDAKKIPELPNYETQTTEYKNFQGEEVTKLIFKNQSDLNSFYKKIPKEIPTYEADIKPAQRFIIDNNIKGTINIEGPHVSEERIDRVYHEPKISPADYAPNLKVISIDTEWDKTTGKLFCIGLYSSDYKKNFMITSKKLKHTVSCEDEADCLEKFKQELIKLDPDIITGWNVIDFDFLFLRNVFLKHKIPFDIGRTNEPCSLRIETSFFRSSKVDISGRQVLDGLNLIKDPFIKEAPTIKQADFPSLTLEDVSQALLKNGKMIKGRHRHEEISKLYEKNTEDSLQKLADYNLLDCLLAYNILEKTKIIDLAVLRSKLTGLTLDKIGGSIVAFDSLYIREANSRKIVSPTSVFVHKEARITGGYVSSLNPGVYKNVLIMDFKSLYPSMIRTFNIDPYSFVENPETKKGMIEAPNKAYFKNQDGILPSIIAQLHEAREQAKKQKNEFANHAIKIIMNSFFGVLASPNCRYFNLKIANAITHFGQFIIKLTAEQIKKRGYEVIYLDTDSVFVVSGLESEEAEKKGEEIQNEINDFYKGYVKEKYSRDSFLELEFEKLYLSMMIPKLRGESEAAAKKRYAGLIKKDREEVIEITGLEAIRGDWTEAAQDFQKELLDKLFHNQKIEPFIHEYIKKIKQGKLDKKLIYKKSIRKSLAEYTKTTPPHVKAARLLPSLDSNVIEYYQTTAGPEPVQQLKHKIDYEHYVEKQIKPIANQILSLLNKDFDDVVKKSRQSKLF